MGQHGQPISGSACPRLDPERDRVIARARENSSRSVSVHHAGTMMEAGGFSEFAPKVMNEVARSPAEIFFPDRSKFERTHPEQYSVIRRWFNAFRQEAELEVTNRLGLEFEPDVKVKYVLFDGAPEYVRNSAGFHGIVRRTVIDGQKYVAVFLSLEHLMATVPRKMLSSELHDLWEVWGSGGRVVLHEIAHSAMDRSSFELMHELPSWYQEWVAHRVARQRSDKHLRVFTNPRSDGMEAYDVFSLSFLEFILAARWLPERAVDEVLAKVLERVLKRKEYLERLEGRKEYRLLRQELVADVVATINHVGKSRDVDMPPIVRDPAALTEWIFSGGWQMYQREKKRCRAGELQGLVHASPSGDEALWDIRHDLLEYAQADPGNPLVDYARVYAAAAAVAVGETDLALAELEEIVFLYSNAKVLAAAKHFIIKALARQARWPEAVGLVRQVRNEQPGSQEDINALVLFELEGLINAGEPDEARRVASEFGSLVVQGAIEISQDHRRRFDELTAMIEQG